MEVELPHQPACAVLNQTITVTDADTIEHTAGLAPGGTPEAEADLGRRVKEYMRGRFGRYAIPVSLEPRGDSLPGIHGAPRGACVLGSAPEGASPGDEPTRGQTSTERPADLADVGDALAEWFPPEEDGLGVDAHAAGVLRDVPASGMAGDFSFEKEIQPQRFRPNYQRPGATIVLAHHKSGTVASANLVVSLCCPEAWNCEPPTRFFKYFLKDDEGFPGCAEHACLDRKVDFAFEGLKSRQPPPADSKVIHFVRDPAEMVVSGYAYHRTCSEPYWTNKHFHAYGPEPLRYGYAKHFEQVLAALGETPSSWAASNMTYCQLLLQKPVHQGLKAETIRTANAYDGVGAMLRDRQTLRGFGGDQLEVCMDKIEPSDPSYNHSWATIAQVAGVRSLRISTGWEANHSTKGDRTQSAAQNSLDAWIDDELPSRNEMARMARAFLSEALAPDLLADFPCAEVTGVLSLRMRSDQSDDPPVASGAVVEP